MDKPIKLLRPTFDEQTKQDLLDVLDSGWASFGPKVEEFERAFAARVGAKYAVATNSATSALDLAIKAHGITSGELITPAFTFTADA
jgi:dTDP-4-amino-4,6-dideoxygalactose transaminase